VKIHILCDLHIEFGEFEPPDVDADMVVLAGDVHVKHRGVEWAKQHLPKSPIVYVCGNHEFYREKFPSLIMKLKQDAKGTNIHILENDSINIGKFRIFGCTLWSDLDIYGNFHMASIAVDQGMTDYHLIRLSQSYRRLSPKDTRLWHFYSLCKLTEFLEKSDPSKSIVVTHHAPSARSIVDRFKNDALTPAFASNLDEFILKFQPLLWIHGHTHESFDYQIGNTRIICNPRGYVPEINPEFMPSFTVDI
jgi:predicted phosphodiesterase